MLFTFFSGN